MTREEKLRQQRLDFMREQVREIELQAKYWESMYKVKYFTLEDAKLREAYESHVMKVQDDAQKALEELEESGDPNLTIESTDI